jgi:hypothetical protein
MPIGSPCSGTAHLPSIQFARLGKHRFATHMSPCTNQWVAGVESLEDTAVLDIQPEWF